MSDPIAEDMTGQNSVAADVFAGRIDVLYRLGRHHLFLPFSALCIAGVLYRGIVPVWLAIIPLLLQIAVTVVTARVTAAYAARTRDDQPEKWANRYTALSAAAGASWGVGAVLWFQPHTFPAEAFLTIAFLGMTSAEFIARSVHRPAYIAHATLSLGPLAMMLAAQGSTYALMSSVLVLFFAGVLYSYCDEMASILDESIRLRRENADLVVKLSREKGEAEKARDLAEASTRAKSAFIANISHEIRTPLNALLGMAQLLERSELDRAQRNHVKVLLEAGRGLKTLLDDVIALSVDEGRFDGQPDDDCDAAQAARTVARLLQPRAWEKQLRLTVTAAINLPRVAADPRRVRRVLLKLADNAVKFTDRGGIEIRVEAETSADGAPMLRFSLTDTGLGITPEIAAHLFEPFAQAEISYARRHEGAGLGLAVAKRTIEGLGGAIGFESEAGQGATFWFTVPAIRVQQQEYQDSMPIATDSAPPWGLSILTVLDDEAIRTQITNLLEPFGNRLVFADSAAAAIVLAGRESFDAIIALANVADSIAAAPGVNVPLLALMPGGMRRTPAAASGVLRWPAHAGALYSALRDLLGRGADPGTSHDMEHEAIAAIDAPAFAALEKSLGLTTLIEILQSYMKTAEELCARLSADSETENWEDAARVAQDIAGAAGGLGLAALTAAARGFTQKAREGDGAGPLRDAAQTIVGEHERVRNALANLYPDLAA
ncbi:MAG TPA: ATP-binding protein [Rhizomicrobium sp.]|jgi:signal transduction histidine kinase/HPt (histidine-containing phosphotransfer) domain-containing protein|nr:ATP-binding protein [Rhizomicrobium sp.]